MSQLVKENCCEGCATLTRPSVEPSKIMCGILDEYFASSTPGSHLAPRGFVLVVRAQHVTRGLGAYHEFEPYIRQESSI